MGDNRNRIHVSFREDIWRTLVDYCRLSGKSYGTVIHDALRDYFGGQASRGLERAELLSPPGGRRMAQDRSRPRG